MTFEEESEAQVEGNRWRRANHIKWKCTSDGGHGVANAREEKKSKGRGWPSGGVTRERERERENQEWFEARGNERGARAALQYPTLDNGKHHLSVRRCDSVSCDRPASK